jgi:long-chain acyl-CoA synthetase
VNIVEPILYQCKLNPWDVAICVPGSPLESITYGRLEKFIHNIARTALGGDLRPGHVVALHVRDVILHAALIYGLARAGMASVSLRDTTIPGGISVDAIITDAPRLFPPGQKVIVVDSTWLMGDGRAPNYDRLFQSSDDHLCLISLTSGSASAPKGVAFTHKLLSERIFGYLYGKGARFQQCSRLFCDLGIGTPAGIRYATYMLLRGGTVYFLGDDPAAILQHLDLHKIQGMATSPYGLGEFVKYFERDSAFECGFDHIICQGAMLSKELSERVRARMCPSLYSSYGATETGTVAFGPASVLAEIPGAVGYVGPGVTVEILDKSGVHLPFGREGAIRIRTPDLAHGYVGDEQATQSAFHDGYFYSGDIGYVTADRILVITGREKTIMNLGGDSVNPETIETVLRGYSGIEQAAVLSMNNELGIGQVYALIVAKSAVDLSALTAYCKAKMTELWVPRRFFVVDDIPKGAQGKIERHRLPDIAKMKMAGQ